MHRATARLLLILLLVGVFVPVALAISAAPAHACCLRNPMHGRPSHEAQFQSPLGCCQHDCCRPLTVSRGAHPASKTGAPATSVSTILRLHRESIGFASSVNHAHPGRAPPPFSVA